MVISNKNKYIFLCLPRTGTTAIRNELCENYDGEEILYKHAPYDKFLKIADGNQLAYNVIASVRNPLDRTVSLYFKYKSNHDGIHQRQIKNIGDKNFLQKFFIFIANSILKNRAKYVSNQKISFSTFIKKYYTTPYSDWHSLYWHKYDYVLRFERINEDFKYTLGKMNITPKRDIPVVNKTRKETVSFEKYYTSDIIPLVQKNFYFAMKMYGYDFPSDWPEYKPGIVDIIRYRTYTGFKQIYWKYIR